MLGLAQDVQSHILGMIGRLKYQLLERHFIHTIRIGLVLSTVVLTLVMSVLLSNRGMIGLAVVGGIAGIVILILLYKNMAHAAIMLLVTSTILEIRLPNDLSFTLLLLITFTLFWLVRLLLVERSFRSVRPTVLNYIVLMWAISVTISFLWSSHYVEPAVRHLQDSKLLPRLSTLFVMILSPVGMLIFANFLRTLDDIKRVIWYFIAFSAVNIVFFMPLTRALVPPNLTTEGQWGAWASIFALGQILYNPKLSRRMRVFLIAFLAACCWVLVGLRFEWLSGWVPLLIGCTVVIFLRSKVGFVVLMILLLVYGVIQREAINATFTEEQAASGDTRAAAASTALTIAENHFLFGTGPAGYFFYMTVDDSWMFQLSHNTYVDMFAENGIVGFVIYVGMWLGVGWVVLRTYLVAPKRGFEGGLAASLAGIYPATLVLMGLGDWGIPFTYTQTMGGVRYTIWLWLWAGMAIALRYLVQHHALQTQSAAQSA